MRYRAVIFLITLPMCSALAQENNQATKNQLTGFCARNPEICILGGTVLLGIIAGGLKNAENPANVVSAANLLTQQSRAGVGYTYTLNGQDGFVVSDFSSSGELIYYFLSEQYARKANDENKSVGAKLIYSVERAGSDAIIIYASNDSQPVISHVDLSNQNNGAKKLNGEEERGLKEKVRDGLLRQARDLGCRAAPRPVQVTVSTGVGLLSVSLTWNTDDLCK